jgi:hypothetical protein
MIMSLMTLAMVMAFAHAKGDEEIMTCGSTVKLIHIETVSGLLN